MVNLCHKEASLYHKGVSSSSNKGASPFNKQASSQFSKVVNQSNKQVNLFSKEASNLLREANLSNRLVNKILEKLTRLNLSMCRCLVVCTLSLYMLYLSLTL